MKTRCHCCDELFDNVNSRRKHHRLKPVCTSPEMHEKWRLGIASQEYQQNRRLEKNLDVITRYAFNEFKAQDKTRRQGQRQTPDTQRKRVCGEGAVRRWA